MRVEVSGRQFVFPPYCACCGAAADTRFTAAASRTTGKKVQRTTTNTWDFPYCSRCISHVNAAQSAKNLSNLVAAGSILMGIFLCFGMAPWFGFFAAISGSIGAFAIYKNLMAQAHGVCSPQCACVSPSVAFLDWNGTQQVFEITSQPYALAFMIANEKKLINVSSHARHLLAANGYGLQANNQQSARRYRG